MGKMISREDYRKALDVVMDKFLNDPEIDGMKKFLIPMMAMMFIKDMETELFGEEDKNND